MTLTLGGITFDQVVYDAGGDVLYLHVGDPSTAAEFDGVPEGHHVRYAADGSLVGITLLSPKWLLEHDGEIVLTLPERTIRTSDLGSVLAAA